jgi:hypothetical protein
MKTNKRTITSTLTIAAVALGLPLFFKCGDAANATVIIDEFRSQMPGFTSFQLPDNGQRITDTSLTTALTGPLKEFAKESGITLRSTEVAQWSEGGSETRDMLMYTLKGAGYEYKELGEKKKDDVTMTVFTARQSGDRVAVAGYWIERKGQLTLVWGCSGVTVTKKADVEQAILPDSPEVKPVARGTVKSGVPASLLGPTWSSTSISSSNYVNQYGQMAEPSGMSASYTFTRDGRYKFFFYVRQRTYNLVSESTTRHEGKVTFTGENTFTVYPEKGTYKGNTGSRIIDRPMTARERKPVTWYYEWRTEDGQRALYIGPNKASARRFKQG